jgi:hypothetical protein
MSDFYRKFALENLNVEKQVYKYLSLLEKNMSEENPKYEISEEAKNKTAEQFLSDFMLIDQMIQDWKKKRDDKIKELLEAAPGLTVMITEMADGSWTRVKLIDNLESFESGKYWVPVNAKRFHVKVENFKHKPKEMGD